MHHRFRGHDGTRLAFFETMRPVPAKAVLTLVGSVGLLALIGACTAQTGGPGTTRTLQPAASRTFEPVVPRAVGPDLLATGERGEQRGRDPVMEGRLAPVEGSPSAAHAEPREGTPSLDAFAYWDDDEDGVLTPHELTDTMIAAWDADDDGVVDRAEWPG